MANPEQTILASAKKTAAWLSLLASISLVDVHAIELDVPFVVSPPAVTQAMLEIAAVKSSDFVLDLGSGDGRIVILAAKNFGAAGLGVEIDPALVADATRNAARAGVADRATFLVQDLFATDLSKASVITMYLLPEVNLALRPKLLALKPGTRLVSHDWNMGDWPADKMIEVDVPDKKLGRQKLSKVMLWVVPARVAGDWCSTDGSALHIEQRYQRIEGKIKFNRTGSVRELVFGATLAGGRFTIAGAARDGVGEFEADKLTLDLDALNSGAAVRFERSKTACAAPTTTRIATQ